jgi:ribonuclease P protein component
VGAAGLPPIARLHEGGDFATLNTARHGIDSRYFRLRHVPGKAAGARLGMAVSRKVSKLAVERNRIKRCIRESFRHNRDDLPARDLLVIARGSAATAANAALRSDLEALWSRLRALKPAPLPGTIAR